MTIDVSRRRLFQAGGLAVVGGGLLSACHKKPHDLHAESPADALKILEDGNTQFVKHKLEDDHGAPAKSDKKLRSEQAGGQHPIALIFSCIDSRVPPELVFNRRIGELMVIRTAAHSVSPAALGSLEYGAEHLHSIKTLMVLGHERCGAVIATMEAVEAGAQPTGGVGAVVNKIRPALDLARGRDGDLTDNVVRAHIALTVEEVKKSAIIKHHVEEGTLSVVGARYDLDSGKVEITVPAKG